jgi:hypothetical protein
VMRIPKPVRALAVATIVVAVALGCLAQVF